MVSPVTKADLELERNTEVEVIDLYKPGDVNISVARSSGHQEDYDGEGALTYIIVVIMVYGMSMFLLVARVYNRKPYHQRLDVEVNRYTSGMEAARLQARKERVQKTLLRWPGNFIHFTTGRHNYDSKFAAIPEEESCSDGNTNESDLSSYTEMPATTMRHQPTSQPCVDDAPDIIEMDYLPNISVEYLPGFRRQNRRRVSMLPDVEGPGVKCGSVKKPGILEVKATTMRHKSPSSPCVVDATESIEMDYLPNINVEYPPGFKRHNRRRVSMFPDDDNIGLKCGSVKKPGILKTKKDRHMCTSTDDECVGDYAKLKSLHLYSQSFKGPSEECQTNSPQEGSPRHSLACEGGTRVVLWEDEERKEVRFIPQDEDKHLLDKGYEDDLQKLDIFNEDLRGYGFKNSSYCGEGNDIEWHRIEDCYDDMMMNTCISLESIPFADELNDGSGFKNSYYLDTEDSDDNEKS